jgi:hypothetical protein
MCSRKRTLMLCGLIAAGLLVGSMSWQGAARPAVADGDSFNPSFAGSVSNPEADTPSDVTADYHIPDGDLYDSFEGDFTPIGWQWTPSSEVDLGVQRDVMDVVMTMGFGNNPCNTSLSVHFDMLNATTDKSRTVTFQDGFDDSNGDGNPDFIDMYPDFNDRILGPAQPIVRDVGIADLAGTKLLMQFLLYEPGATLFGRTFDPALGEPYLGLAGNMGDPEAVPNPSAQTDTCSPLDFTIVFFGATQDGTVLVKNPKEAGTYTFNTLWVAQRDADADGHENTLDPCPLDPDPTWDPTAAEAVGPGDADGDGLPSSCDPDDSNAVNDEDGDGYLNRGDNCPLVPNGVDQAGTAVGNQKDTDSDGIGDACDPNPDQADTEGEAAEVLVSSDVTITEAAQPVAPQPVAPSPVAEAPAPAALPAAGSGGLLGEEGSSLPTWWYALPAGGTLLIMGGLAGLWRARSRR